jgi:glycine/D-amino acid oxidase-like deaminating enzyme
MKIGNEVSVIGGGFFGCALSVFLARKGCGVTLFEAGPELMKRASHHNQARIHNGYHYPRSILTALRSRVNFPRFVGEYEACVNSSFEHYYAVPRKFSKVSARQFRLFMERIGAPIQPAPASVKKMMNDALVEDVFQVTEYAFDSRRLREIVAREMEEAGVRVRLNSRAERVDKTVNGILRLSVESVERGDEIFEAPLVFHCTYANLNQLLTNSGLPRLKLKQEITEMALICLPEELRSMAFTVMCGPFFSTMPFPSVGLHTLSHVRYTPHASWMEGPDLPYETGAYEVLRNFPKTSRFVPMRQDAARYLPGLTRTTQSGSIWEVKTVLPQSEIDDSRPILFKRIREMPGLFCIMGGKIDNIFDVFDEVTRMIS